MRRAPPEATMPDAAIRADAEAWFAGRGWVPFGFQRAVWAAMADGKSGLLHATTGSGKTYAVWMGALARAHPPDRARPLAQVAGRGAGAHVAAGTARGLQVLWLTPMRALAADTQRALE